MNNNETNQTETVEAAEVVETALEADGYELCDRFADFADRKIKFVGREIVFADEYKVDDTELLFENCTLVFAPAASPAIAITGGELMFVNCVFVSRLSEEESTVFSVDKTDVVVQNCTFRAWETGLFLSANVLEAGGAVKIKDTTFTDSNMNIVFGDDIEFSHCIFAGCHGDMPTLFMRKTTFSSCEFTNHSGNMGTAMFASSHLVFKACRFKGFQGSIYANTIEASDSIFENCAADPTGSGINVENLLYISDASFGNWCLGMLATGSLFEIKKTADSPVSQVRNCQFNGCTGNGALVAVIAEEKNARAVRINNCKIADCRYAEGYFVGAYKKVYKELDQEGGNKVYDKIYKRIHPDKARYFLAPQMVDAWDNAIDIYDDERQKRLRAFLKSALTDGFVKGCTTFHKYPVGGVTERNIRAKIMSGADDEILTMYDKSILGKGKEGWSFGYRALYSSQMMEANYYLPYEKIALIKDVAIEHKKAGDNYGATLTIELGNDRCIEFSDPYLEKRELKKLLLGIKAALAKVC
jgi:hypothetical protein